MRLRALHTSGILDISSLENLGGDWLESRNFRITLKPGQVITVPDEYRDLTRVKDAIAQGLLEVIDYDSTAGSIVVNEELDLILIGAGVYSTSSSSSVLVFVCAFVDDQLSSPSKPQEGLYPVHPNWMVLLTYQYFLSNKTAPLASLLQVLYDWEIIYILTDITF